MKISKDRLIEKLKQIVHNLTLIQWMDIEDDMSKKAYDLINIEIKELNKIIIMLKSDISQLEKEAEAGNIPLAHTTGCESTMLPISTGIIS